MMTERMTIPKWYCPYKLDWVSKVQPVVQLVGLDAEGNGVHRSIWEVLMSSKDFVPNYVNVPLQYTVPLLPIKKQRRESVESYLPYGILPTTWTKKHTDLVPAVLVLFVDCNWSEPNWKDDCVSRVKDLKKECAPHGTLFLLMLVKCGGEEHLSTEKASALCATAEIPPKSLYILSHAHPERIQTSVHRLENGMRDAAGSYYASRIRRVKNRLEQATQGPLIVRYNIKLGFFQEIRRDYVSAMSHYDAAMKELSNLRFTDGSAQEIKVVASVVNYRQCRIHLLRMEGRDAKGKFDQHVRSWGHTAELEFEHMAWLEQQYHNFGDLLKQYYRKGNTTLGDPVSYLMRAAFYAKMRVKNAATKFGSQEGFEWPSVLKGFEKEEELKYVGQRPWKTDTFRPATSYPPEDPPVILALQYLEAISPHSEYYIRHLGIASDFCKSLNRRRTRCELMVKMGEEFGRVLQHEKCIKLMTYVLRELGGTTWHDVIYHVAILGLAAACFEADIPATLNFILILLKKDLDELVRPTMRTFLWSTFTTILDKRAIHMNDNPELNKKWEAAIVIPTICYVEVHRECILDAQFSLLQDAVSAHSSAVILVLLVNRHEFPIPIRKMGVRTNFSDYNCEENQDFTLAVGESRECQLQFTPLPKDIGKVVQIQVGFVDIGKKDCQVLVHYSLIANTSPTLWISGSLEKMDPNFVKIIPPVTSMEALIIRNNPALTGEWIKMDITWTNTGDLEVTRVLVAYLASSPEPQNIQFSLDPENHTNSSPLGHSLEVERLAPAESISTVVFVKNTKSDSDLKFLTKIKYIDGSGQGTSSEKSEVIETLPPFEMTQRVTNMPHMEPLSQINLGMDFLLFFDVTNVSSSVLILKEAQLNLKSENFKARLVRNDNEVVLVGGEEASFYFNLKVESFHCTKPLGSLQLGWKRENEEGGVLTQTEVLADALVIDPLMPLYLRAILEMDGETGVGLLKKPLVITFILLNMTASVFDIILSIETTESFMNGGAKKTNVKINGKDQVDLKYTLFPLKTGLLRTPKLLIEQAGIDPTSPPSLPYVHQDVPKYIYVTRPKEDSGER